MKKYFCTMINGDEAAFFLPYVVVIATILFISFHMTLHFYEVEQRITHNLEEQIKIDNILRMAKKKFIEEKVYEEAQSGETSYVFPEGEVEVEFVFQSETELLVRYWIILSEETNLLFNDMIRFEEET